MSYLLESFSVWQHHFSLKLPFHFVGSGVFQACYFFGGLLHVPVSMRAFLDQFQLLETVFTTFCGSKVQCSEHITDSECNACDVEMEQNFCGRVPGRYCAMLKSSTEALFF